MKFLNVCNCFIFFPYFRKKLPLVLLFFMRQPLTLFSIFLLLLVFLSPTSGQDTLVMLNGKYKTEIDFLSLQNGIIEYRTDKKNTSYINHLAQDEVLAVFSNEGRFIVTHFTDSSGNKLSDEAMYDYIQGMTDARASYRNILVPAACFTISAATGIFVGVPFGLLVPLALPVAKTIHEPKTENLHIDDVKDVQNEHYVSGYKEIAKNKKVRSSVISSGSGFLLGLLVNIYVFKQK